MLQWFKLVQFSSSLLLALLLVACGPVKPQVMDHVGEPLVLLHESELTYCEGWFGRKTYEVRYGEPDTAPLYCVVQHPVATIPEGTYFHITHIEYDGDKTCFDPPDIVIDTGYYRGQRARLMYYLMQVANPAVHGCQFQLPFWVVPAGYVSPFQPQLQRLGIYSVI